MRDDNLKLDKDYIELLEQIAKLKNSNIEKELKNAIDFYYFQTLSDTKDDKVKALN